MPAGNEVHVFDIALDDPGLRSLPAEPDEAERAARFAYPHLRERYLASHAALRSILGRYCDAPMEFAAGEHGKPYLRTAQHVQFNLSHSHERAMVAVALHVPVGIDIERLRPMPDSLQIAERFFPPIEAADFAELPAGERDRAFFKVWTRLEALWKAQGVGLYGAGAPSEGEWMVANLDAGPDFAAAVAVRGSYTTSSIRHFKYSVSGTVSRMG